MDEYEASNAEAGPSTATYPTAPVYNFDIEPRCISTLGQGEVDSEVKGNFFRSARWCADGTSILATSEDRAFRIIDTSADAEPDLTRYRTFPQPDAIHASLWYPTASLLHPETFCFVASIRDTPVRLIDATDGRIRATYPIIDHTERFIAPHSLAFSPDASRLYCGHENAIEVLDIATPGPGGSERIKTTSTKREKGGQKGIISALAFCTDYSGTYAAGSFSRSVVLYQEDHDGAVGHLEGITGGGVTQLQFHPLSPKHLFVASRRSDQIQIYDLRNPSQPSASVTRRGPTNQRLWFDLDPWGRYLAAGDESGQASVWDISSLPHDEEPSPVLKMQRDLAKDAIGSIQFHPFKPLIMTAAGSRRDLPKTSYDSGTESESDDESDESSDESSNPESTGSSPQTEGVIDLTLEPRQRSVRNYRVASTTIGPVDDALRLWSFQ